MKKSLVAGCNLLFAGLLWGAECCAVSPDGRNEIRLGVDLLVYEVVRDGVVVSKSEIGLKVDGKYLSAMKMIGDGFPVLESRSLTGSVDTPVYKKMRVDLSGNEAFADFGDWGVRLVARNDGVAYRFETKIPGRIRVECERADVAIPDSNAKCTVCYGAAYGCEESVSVCCAANDVRTDEKDHKFVYLPFVYEIAGKHVVVTESDVCDYPILNFVRKNDKTGVVFGSDFAGWPKRTHRAGGWTKDKAIPSGGRWAVIEEHEKWLVETAGMRTFPWRTFILADEPSKFCEADIVFALARPSDGGDFSWVRPGKVAWDWWNAWDNKGEKDGCTTATYKRFVDFASKSGVEYVILDEGWSETLNIWKFHPDIDVPELIRYGKEKGVGIILWMAWAQIVGEEERVARHFSLLGAKGFKVDFMDRGDAACERFLWKFAAACAKNRMLVDYHGAHRPTGLSRAYPNVLNYEGVYGLEQMKFYKGQDILANDVAICFTRMSAGPMDYTPGAMDNYPVGKYPSLAEKDVYTNPGSLGTRCRQMAMMVLYEAPLQMLCDSVKKYRANAECFKFMAATPVVWDDTVGLGGTPWTYVGIARKAKDGSWYAAAITNKEERDIIVDTSFLGAGIWKVESFSDAADADVSPTHYTHSFGKIIAAGAKIKSHLAPGGGVVFHFFK